jgi:hypothetical protein
MTKSSFIWTEAFLRLGFKRSPGREAVRIASFLSDLVRRAAVQIAQMPTTFVLVGPGSPRASQGKLAQSSEALVWAVGPQPIGPP